MINRRANRPTGWLLGAGLTAAFFAAAACGGSSHKTAATTTTPGSPAAPPSSSAPAAAGATTQAGGNYHAAPPSAAAPAAPAPQAARVTVRVTSLGTILTDANGRTLYEFKGDEETTSMCTGACAANWPPLLTHGAPLAGPGTLTTLLGTTNRADGTVQVTYNGHPLYYFVGDRAPGQTNGEALNAFGDDWYVLGADGDKIEPPGSS